MKIKTKLITFTASATLLALSLPAQAAFSWTFDSSPTNTGTPSGTAITATASAWTTATTSTNSRLQSAQLRQYSGLGVQSQSNDSGSPQHAIDANGQKESVLFSFTQSIALTKISMSWLSGDADFSLLRYVGGSAPILGSQSYAGLLTNGWELVSRANYSGGYNTGGYSLNSNGSGSTANVNLNELSSSHWLVAAANTAHGWASGYTENDYFKLNKLYGKAGTPPPPPPTGVPSPSTLPLLAISLLGLGFASRRRKQA